MQSCRLLFQFVQHTYIPFSFLSSIGLDRLFFLVFNFPFWEGPDPENSASGAEVCGVKILGSLSNDVFERRTSTGSCPFSFLGDGFAQIFSQIVSIRVKKLSNTNYIASRHITREKSSLPVNVRCSKTSLLKLPIIND